MQEISVNWANVTPKPTCEDCLARLHVVVGGFMEHWIHVQEVAGRLRLVESYDDSPCGRWLPSEAAGNRSIWVAGAWLRSRMRARSLWAFCGFDARVGFYRGS